MRKEVVRLVLGLAALALVLWGAVVVLQPFARAVLWAAILGLATWPAHRWLSGRFPGGPTASALVMTVIITLIVVLPVGGLALVLAYEIEPMAVAVQSWAQSERLELPPALRDLPFVTDIAEHVHEVLSNAQARKDWIRRLTDPEHGGAAAQLGRDLVKNVVTLALTLFTLFFVFRDGEAVALELRILLDRIAGGRGRGLLIAVRTTVRAVFYGWILTAAVQGMFAMTGYWMAGLRAPVLLGAATGLAAVIPFGITLVWLPVAIGLAADGDWGRAIFVACWNIFVVGLIDNVLRPLFISGHSKIPFILVFFGVLGGLAKYGLLGLVLGPVILAVLLALWRTARESLSDVEGGDEPEAAES